MKTTVKLAGLVLLVLVAFSLTANAQRGMRGNGMRNDSLRIRELRTDMAPGRMVQRGHFNGRGQMNGIRQGSFRGPGDMYNTRQGRGLGPGTVEGMGRGAGRLITESVPNVTEKQKKDIADLLLKQQEDMKKFRQDMASEMQVMRDSHKKSILNILTEEQQKFIDSKQGRIVENPAKVKQNR